MSLADLIREHTPARYEYTGAGVVEVTCMCGHIAYGVYHANREEADAIAWIMADHLAEIVAAAFQSAAEALLAARS